jgi:hypothetical protein
VEAEDKIATRRQRKKAPTDPVIQQLQKVYRLIRQGDEFTEREDI